MNTASYPQPSSNAAAASVSNPAPHGGPSTQATAGEAVASASHSPLHILHSPAHHGSGDQPLLQVRGLTLYHGPVIQPLPPGRVQLRPWQRAWQSLRQSLGGGPAMRREQPADAALDADAIPANADDLPPPVPLDPTVMPVLDDIHLRLMSGRSLGLVGESGSGKSTLARVVMGLQPPTVGQVLFDGQDIYAMEEEALRRARRHFQMVFQDPASSFNPRMTVGESLAEPLIAQQETQFPRVLRRRVGDALRQVGLHGSDADRYPHEFSGGQRQRLAIARALITRPRLIVADEPVSGLDVSVQAQVLNLMLELQQQLGIAYLFISHDLAVVSHLCDEIAVMSEGRIVERGPARRIIQSPQDPYTRSLLRCVPHIQPGAARIRRQFRAQGLSHAMQDAALAPAGHTDTRDMTATLQAAGLHSPAQHAAAAQAAGLTPSLAASAHLMAAVAPVVPAPDAEATAAAQSPAGASAFRAGSIHPEAPGTPRAPDMVQGLDVPLSQTQAAGMRAAHAQVQRAESLQPVASAEAHSVPPPASVSRPAASLTSSSPSAPTPSQPPRRNKGPEIDLDFDF